MTADLDEILAQPISACMTESMVSIDQNATLRQAAEGLAERGIGLILVIDGTDLLGVLSERDIVAAVANGDDLDSVRLADRARGDILTVASSTSIRKALSVMVRSGTRHLVVTAADGLPKGVVSVRDIVSELVVA